MGAIGTISVNKLGGLAIIFGPVFTLVFFFLQPGGAIIDAADPASAVATISAMLANSGLATLCSVLIPVGLLIMLFGMTVVQGNLRSDGNGDALSRLGLLFLTIGIVCWVIGSGANLAIAGTDLPVEQAIPTYGSLYAATLGLSTTGGLLAGIGFLAIALAISTREDYNRTFALVAVAAAVVSIVVTIIGGMDSSQLELMTQITGIPYLIHTAWVITIGRKLIREG